MEFICSGRIKVNGIQATENIITDPSDKIDFDGRCIREKKHFTYIIYNKPAGIETTMNKGIANGLKSTLHLEDDLYHIGRLDKESEGILLLSNDGSLGKKLLNKINKIEKEYLVSVDKTITKEFLDFMRSGVSIMGKTTEPCHVEKLDEHTFKITLIEGMNRQIRRMCYKAGLNVVKLVRVKFAGISNLPKSGEYRLLIPEEIALLKG